MSKRSFDIGSIKAKKAKLDQKTSNNSGSSGRLQNPYLSQPVQPEQALQLFLTQVRNAARKSRGAGAALASASTLATLSAHSCANWLPLVSAWCWTSRRATSERSLAALALAILPSASFWVLVFFRRTDSHLVLPLKTLASHLHSLDLGLQSSDLLILRVPGLFGQGASNISLLKSTAHPG